MQASPGKAIARIAEEIGNAYNALAQLIGYVQRNATSQDSKNVGYWIQHAEPSIVGLEQTINTLLGVNHGSIVQGGVVAHAWMLDGAVKVTGDQELYSNPEKVRQLATGWKSLPKEFKTYVQDEMNKTAPPIQSIADYAALSPHRQEAYTRFDELLKCGGRGIQGHGHDTTVPQLWVPGIPVEESTEAAAYLNHALSSKAKGGISIGRYSSDTCAWDQLQDRTPPGALAMVAEKAVALSKMFGSIGLSSGAPDDIRRPLSSIANSYESIAKAAAPSLYALRPVTTTSQVRGL
jgi:hypothetical protein